MYYFFSEDGTLILEKKRALGQFYHQTKETRDPIGSFKMNLFLSDSGNTFFSGIDARYYRGKFRDSKTAHAT